MKLRERGPVHINVCLCLQSIFMAKFSLFHFDVIIILIFKFLQLASSPIKKLAAADSADYNLCSIEVRITKNCS